MAIPPYVVDYTGEWNYIDGVETGSVQPQNAPAAPILNVKMRRGEVSRSMLGVVSGGLAIQPTDQQFAVWTATLAGYTLQNGDFLTDGNGTVWTCLLVKQRADNAQATAVVRGQK